MAGTNCRSILQVVIGIGDPNPLVSGSGAKTLLDAGIEVAFVGGEEAEESYALNRDFMLRMKELEKLQSAPAASSMIAPAPLDPPSPLNPPPD